MHPYVNPLSTWSTHTHTHTKTTKQFLPNTYFSLDFCITQGTHNSPWLDIGTTRCYIPRRHPYPKFQPSHNGWSIPQSKWSPCLHCFCQKFMSGSKWHTKSWQKLPYFFPTVKHTALTAGQYHHMIFKIWGIKKIYPGPLSYHEIVVLNSYFFNFQRQNIRKSNRESFA
jgi:hypothetical protein